MTTSNLQTIYHEGKKSLKIPKG